MISRRTIVHLAAASALYPALAARASAQAIAWPNRYVRLVVPFPPGGGTDAIARVVAGKLSEIWGQQVVVENRGGAATNIGTEAVVRAEPDGYTMLLHSMPLAVNKFLFASLPYDPVADLAPISLLCDYPNIMAVPNISPAHSVTDFIAHAKTNRGKITFASSGHGTSVHLSGELFKRMAGIEMLHVPYRGAGPAFNDLIPGRVDVMFNNIGAVLPLIQGGKLRGLAVTTAKRTPAAPELPPIAEAGVPGFDVSSWYAFLVPAKTPPEIIRKMHADTVAALTDPATKQKLEALGVVVRGSSPDELAVFLKAEMDKWGPLIKEAGITGTEWAPTLEHRYSSRSSTMRSIIRALAIGLLAALATAAQAQPADTILVNGKIVTVDDRFSIVESLAIRADRIVAVGTAADTDKLKGPQTRVIDLNRRTVIPGLIDNHAHWVRAAEHDELRFDGVTTRQRALELLAERVRSAKPGEWIAVLGGWSEEQFTDDPRGFPLAELDRIAPNNPVAIQAVYNHTYLNSVGLAAAKIDASTPNPQGGAIEKDASGKPNGLVRGAGGVAFVAARIPLETQEVWLANTRKLVRYLNSLGLTAWLDAGGRGMGAKHYEPYKALADRGELNIRLFWTAIRQPATPAQVDAVIAEIPQQKPFQGSAYFDQVGWGESVYAPVTTQLLRVESNTKPEDLAQMRRLLVALAEHGLYVNSHVEMEAAIDAFLNVYESINKERPIKGLHWSFSHLDQVTPAQLERMKRLGMSAQIHSRPLIQGALMHKVHGDKAWDMPPFRRVQDSGIHWGLGSDATAVTTSNPFYTLSLAVTGKMIGGREVNRQTITREEALIAHTRSNARFLFQEGDLGSLANGKYADLLVLDRDYLTVPADEIKDIKPLMTMVGGKVVYDAMPK